MYMSIYNCPLTITYFHHRNAVKRQNNPEMTLPCWYINIGFFKRCSSAWGHFNILFHGFPRYWFLLSLFVVCANSDAGWLVQLWSYEQLCVAIKTDLISVTCVWSWYNDRVLEVTSYIVKDRWDEDPFVVSNLCLKAFGM